MIKFYFLLSILFCLYLPSYAQEFWSPAGPLAGGDYVPAIECTASGTILAYSNNHGIYRSTDDGNTWTMTGISNQKVSAIQTAPDGKIYAACSTTSGIFVQRSTDDGMTWDIVYSSSRPNNFFIGGGIACSGSDTIVAVIAFTIGPTVGDIASEIVRSSDGGSTWQLLGTAYGWDASDLAKLAGGRIVAALGLSGVAYSSDNGSTWNGFPGFPSVYPTFVEGDSQGRIFVGISTAATQVSLLYRSTDNGNSWQGLDIYSGTQGDIRALYVDQQDRLYVSTNTFNPDAYNIFRSEDGGTSWDTLNSGLPSGQLVRSLCGNSADVIFAGTGNGGVFIGTDVTPVELASFNVSAEGNSVNLRWSTASELNNKGFEVQRIKTGSLGQTRNSNWETIGFAAGHGTTVQSHSYLFDDMNVPPGSYLYRLKQMDFDGAFNYSKESELTVTAPGVFSLEQNYPNPFNPTTEISYQLPQNSYVTLKVYNMLGEEAASLVNEVQNAGRHTLTFNAAGLSSGIYFYTLSAGHFSKTHKMILLR